jgi:S1-C subfamily serine protease
MNYTTNHPAHRTAGGTNQWLCNVLAGLLTVLALIAPTAATPLAATPGPLATHSASTQVTDAPSAARAMDVSPELVGLVHRVSLGMVDITAYLGARRVSMGTGIVLSPDGLVLTNAHVVAHAAAVSVTALSNGDTYPAAVIGASTTHDIALVRMRGASSLPTADLGDSDTVRVGDMVASLGNAYGIGRPCVGVGPITHLRRSIAPTADTGHDAAPMRGLIEARSNIQPGESGGPMVTQDGEVIGVNVAYEKAPGSQSPSGIGYAIPINRALAAAHALLSEHTDDSA